MFTAQYIITRIAKVERVVNRMEGLFTPSRKDNLKLRGAFGFDADHPKRHFNAWEEVVAFTLGGCA